MSRHVVVTTERAARDIEDSAAWWARERSVEQSLRWYHAAIAQLSDSPERYPIATEQSRVNYEIRELHYGVGSKPTHRVIFTIVGQSVLVLTVRHAARAPISADDLL